MDQEPRRQALRGNFAAVAVADIGHIYICYGRPLFVVLLLTSRLHGLANGEQISYDVSDGESSCLPDEYYDGVVDRCVACTDICLPQQPLDFCRINCPDYYQKHFGAKTSNDSTPATNDVTSRKGNSNINSEPVAPPAPSALYTSSRLPVEHIRQTTPAGPVQEQVLNIQAQALVQTDHPRFSTSRDVPVPTTVNDAATGNQSFIIVLLCSVIVIMGVLTCAMCCLICLVCRSRRRDAGGSSLTAAFRGLVDVEHSNYSWKKNGDVSSGSRPSSLSGSASKCGGAVDGFDDTRLLSSCSSDTNSEHQHHQPPNNQSTESRQSLLTSSLLLQDDERSIRTCNNELVQLKSGSLQSASPSVSVVCTLSLHPGNVNDGSGNGESGSSKVVLVTCSMCPSNNEALAVASAAERDGESSQV